MLKKKIFFLSLLIFIFYGIVVLNFQEASITCLINHEIRQDSVRTLNSMITLIDSELVALDRSTKDYTTWDDLYNYIQTKDSSFISLNMYDDSLKNLSIHAYAIYNVKGEFISGKKLDASNNTTTLQELISKSRLLPLDFTKTGKTSFFKADGQLYMFSAQPIRDSLLTKPSRGVLFFIRPAEPYLIDKMTPWLQSPPLFVDNCDFISPQRSLLNTWFSATLSKSPISEHISSEIKIDDSQKDVLQMYYGLKDYDGKVVRYLKTQESSPLFRDGKKIIQIVGLLTFFTGLVVAYLFGILFNKTFVYPLEKLRHSMTKFTDEKPHEIVSSLTANLKRKDEVGDLTRGFVEMKESVHHAYEYMKNINYILEEKVNLRTLELQEANNELVLSDAIIRNSCEGILICDADNKITRVNDAFCEMSGFTKEELLGNNPRLLKSFRHGEAFYKAMWEKIMTTGSWSGEIWDRKKNGEIYPKWLSISVIRDENNEISYFTSISSDISRIKETEEQLKLMAFYDFLTGLPNRALFNDRLSQTIKNTERYSTKFAIFFMDLDEFKQVNDTYGHNIGDELLVLVGKRLSERVRKSDTVARLGGDEFTIILHPIAWELNLSAIADKIIKAIEEPFMIGDIEIKISVSIGIAVVPDDDDTLEGIISKADSAMYLSKSKGRGCYTFVSEDIQ